MEFSVTFLTELEISLICRVISNIQRNASSMQIFILMFICATGSCVSGDGGRSVLSFKVKSQIKDKDRACTHSQRHTHTRTGLESCILSISLHANLMMDYMLEDVMSFGRPSSLLSTSRTENPNKTCKTV